MREKHLRAYAPDVPIATKSMALRTLITQCLRKAPSDRPSLASVRALLSGAGADRNDEDGDDISAAALLVGQRRERDQAAADESKRHEVERARSAQEAAAALDAQLAELFDGVVASAAGNAERLPEGVRLGDATLTFARQEQEVLKGHFNRFGWEVRASAIITLSWGRPFKLGHRSSNLWYARSSRAHGFRWWEVAFRSTQAPGLPAFGVPAEAFVERADAVLRAESEDLSLAGEPQVIDAEGASAFRKRWRRLLAEAAMVGE